MPRVVIFDDDAEQLKHLQLLLEEYGYDVATASGSDDGNETGTNPRAVRIVRSLEKQLEENNSLIRSIIDSLPVLISYIDNTLRYRFTNSFYEEVMEVEADDIVGQPIYDVLGKDYFREVFPQIEAVLSGVKQSFSSTLKIPNGETHHFLVYYIPRWIGEKVVGFYVLAYDNSKILRTEIEREEYLARWNSIAQNSPEKILLLDTDLNIQYVNHSSPGINVEALLGTPVYQYVDENEQEEVRTVLQKVLESGIPATYETRSETVDIGTRFYSNRATPRCCREKIVGITVVSSDITQYKDIEVTVPASSEDQIKLEKARELSLKLNRLSEKKSIGQLLALGLEEGVKLTGSKIGYLHFYNPKNKTISLQMWSRDTMKHCSVPGEDRIYPLKNAGIWADCIRDKKIVIHNDYPSEHNKKGLPEGHVHVKREIGVPVLEKGEVTVIIGVGNKNSDYTDTDANLLSNLAENIWSIVRRKRAEETLHELNKTLEKRVKQRTTQLEAANEELESFAYMVSHDLQAPLRHIAGFISLLQKQPAFEKDEISCRYMNIVDSASKKMGLLIDHLLAYSRLGRSQLRQEEIDSNRLIEESIEQFQQDLTGRAVQWDIKEMPVITGDRCMIAAVWDNLISNAIKYTRNKRVATIEIGVLSARESREPFPVFYIKDNGAGFDMAFASKLFGVFQRMHKENDFEGTGIGLATVQRIIHRHGGRIWARSEIKKGASFFFTIPPLTSEPGPDESQPENSANRDNYFNEYREHSTGGQYP